MKSSKVTHFEIPVDDMEKAKAFYREVFGWNVQVEPRMQYTMATTSETDKMNIPLERGAINGGIIKREGKLKHPLVTLQVDDVDESLAQVKKHGGKIITSKTPMLPIGWFGYFEDPDGNVLGVWQQAKEM